MIFIFKWQVYTTCFNDLCLSVPRIEPRSSACEANALPLRHRGGRRWNRKITCTIYALIISMNWSKLPKSFQFYNLFFNKKAILHLANRWYLTENNLFFNKKAILHLANRWYLTENSFRYWTQRVSSVYIVFHKWSFLYLNLCWCRFDDHTASENRPTAIRSRLIFDIARAWEHNQINSQTLIAYEFV